jgi:hypothetical protein
LVFIMNQRNPLSSITLPLNPTAINFGMAFELVE